MIVTERIKVPCIGLIHDSDLVSLPILDVLERSPSARWEQWLMTLSLPERTKKRRLMHQLVRYFNA